MCDNGVSEIDNRIDVFWGFFVMVWRDTHCYTEIPAMLLICFSLSFSFNDKKKEKNIE